jgi:hypothetical protein
MSDEFERLAPEFLAMARRIFAAGARSERARLRAVLDQDESQALPSRRDPPRPRRAAAGYGAISAPVKQALNELMVDSPEGVSAGDIAAYFELQGSGPTEKQVRAALKQLHNTGDAIRAARGRYLGRQESGARDEPGDESPGPFNLAAE